MTKLKRSSLFLASAGVATVVAVTGSGQAVGAPAKAPTPGPQTGVQAGGGKDGTPAAPATGGSATASKAESAWRTAGDKKTKYKPWQARNLSVTNPDDDYVYSPSAVSNKVVWTVAGDGAVWRTKNAGKSYSRTPLVDPNAGFVEYVSAASKKSAVAAVYTNAVAPATQGTETLWSTKNGGKSWRPILAPATPYAGFACTTFSEDGKHGFTLGGPVDANSNRLTVFTTKNGGKKWKLANPAKSPVILPDNTPNAFETAYCTNGRPTGSKVSIVYRTYSYANTTTTSYSFAERVAYGKKYGAKWNGAATALPVPPDGGYQILDIATHGKRSVGVGSNRNSEVNGSNLYPDPSVIGRGKRFVLGGDTAGYGLNVDIVPDKSKAAVMTGYNGTRITTNGGRTWLPTDLLQYNGGVSCAEKTCWGTGDNNQVSRFRFK